MAVYWASPKARAVFDVDQADVTTTTRWYFRTSAWP
jgi:hypothetical protein